MKPGTSPHSRLLIDSISSNLVVGKGQGGKLMRLLPHLPAQASNVSLCMAVTFLHQGCPVPGRTPALSKRHKSGVGTSGVGSSRGHGNLGPVHSAGPGP